MHELGRFAINRCSILFEYEIIKLYPKPNVSHELPVNISDYRPDSLRFKIVLKSRISSLFKGFCLNIEQSRLQSEIRHPDPFKIALTHYFRHYLHCSVWHLHIKILQNHINHYRRYKLVLLANRIHPANRGSACIYCNYHKLHAKRIQPY